MEGNSSGWWPVADYGFNVAEPWILRPAT